jgi:hypothetical protein
MPPRWLKAAFDLLRQPLAESEVVDRLVATGCAEPAAEKLVAFLPLACGRALLSESGVTFSPMFRSMRADGTIGEPQRLSEAAHWNLITAFVAAQQVAEPAALRLVGIRSAEFDAINKAVANGSRMADLVGSDPIFLLLTSESAHEAPAKPWWAFWRR